MDNATVLGLLLLVIGAFVTRSVWRLGFASGVALERARGALERSVMLVEDAKRDVGKRP